MADPLAASIADLLLSLELGPAAQDASNRFSVEGLTLRSSEGGALEIGIRTMEAASLRLASGPLALELGRLALHQLVARVRIDEGRPRLHSLAAAKAELHQARVNGPVVLPPASKASPHESHAGAWSLVPLAAADGSIRAEVVDAHLLFDADVKVPIRRGQVNFNDATVEHVGPDSRMGVSRLGVYLDAPNGRSYLYQFAAAPVGGVEFERRGTLGARVSDRGSLRLQPFAEGLLRQGPGAHGPGITEQARLLLGRTALSGQVQLGDGKFVAPGVEADVVGRADGRNAVRLHSQAVGRGLSAEIASIAIRNVLLNAKHTRLGCDEITGALLLRVAVEEAQLRFVLDLGDMNISGLRLQTSLH